MSGDIVRECNGVIVSSLKQILEATSAMDVALLVIERPSGDDSSTGSASNNNDYPIDINEVDIATREETPITVVRGHYAYPSNA